MVVSSGYFRVGGGIAFSEKAGFAEVEWRMDYRQNTAIRDAGIVFGGVGRCPNFQGVVVNGAVTVEVPIDVVRQVDDGWDVGGRLPV